MTSRHILGLMPLLFAPALNTAAVAQAGEASVTIESPADGATLDAMEQHKLVYDVVPGPRGDHVHVYIDDVEVDILRELSSSYTLPTLDTGERNICVRVVNRAHVPIGVDGCITVSVE